MKILKRLIFIVIFLPYVIYLFIKWIITGSNFGEDLDFFIDFFNK